MYIRRDPIIIVARHLFSRSAPTSRSRVLSKDIPISESPVRDNYHSCGVRGTGGGTNHIRSWDLCVLSYGAFERQLVVRRGYSILRCHTPYLIYPILRQVLVVLTVDEDARMSRTDQREVRQEGASS